MKDANFVKILKKHLKNPYLIGQKSYFFWEKWGKCPNIIECNYFLIKNNNRGIKL